MPPLLTPHSNLISLAAKPQPEYERLQDTWGIECFTIVMEITAWSLVLAYLYTLRAAIRGTRYKFVLVLTSMLLVSNFAAAIGAIFPFHTSKVIVNREVTYESKESKQVAREMVAYSVLFIFRDIFLNLPIWLFSFRYWNISYAMPVAYAKQQLSLCFKVFSFIIGLIGCAFNVIVPCVKGHYGIKIYSVLDKPKEVINDTWYDYERQYYISLYMVGTGQAISAIFMLWAILKLFMFTTRTPSLRELTKQRYMTLHVVTLALYLVSVLFYYIYVSWWDSSDASA